MGQYSTKSLGEKLREISEAGGISALYRALTASGNEELKSVSGNTAVIIISDGQPETIWNPLLL